MEIYILKSGLCLAVLYAFYKLLLEKESVNNFKRFYLLVTLILSFSIPFITFNEYIEASTLIKPNQSNIEYTYILESHPTPPQTNYLPIILWSIYAFGVLLFSLKFAKNLWDMVLKIKRNPKQKNKVYIAVLLQDLITPHTFFNYIFLNKQKFETHQIPKEVILHEEAHAKQKHSLDVIFIEVLQILFWFNPCIYFVKQSIKLNHEFLADQAVIKKEITPSAYQQILLAFSSSENYLDAKTHQLANTINYSSIKKRFTVMKTKTSKQTFWLRSFMLLPLLAFLIYGFSEKKVVEKPYVLKKNINKVKCR